MFESYSNNNNYCCIVNTKSIKTILNTSTPVLLLLLVLTTLVPSPCDGQQHIPCEGQYRAKNAQNDSQIITANPSCPKYFFIGEENGAISCTASGLPVVTMMWEHIPNPGQNYTVELTPGNWSTFRSEENVNCTLHFSTIEKRFEGTYRCRAGNKDGQISIDYIVKVLNPNTFTRGKPWIFVVYIAGLILAATLINILLSLRIKATTGSQEELVYSEMDTEIKKMKFDANNNELDDEMEDQNRKGQRW